MTNTPQTRRDQPRPKIRNAPTSQPATRPASPSGVPGRRPAPTPKIRNAAQPAARAAAKVPAHVGAGIAVIVIAVLAHLGFEPARELAKAAAPVLAVYALYGIGKVIYRVFGSDIDHTWRR